MSAARPPAAPDGTGATTPTTTPTGLAPHPPVLQISALAKAFASDGARVPVFADVDLQLQRSEFVAMLGESGVGKSTLLNCVAGLDEADSGDIRLAGTAVRALAEAQRAALRRQALGFVFQAFHLLPHLSVAENIGLPLRLLGRRDDARVAQLLAAVGLAGLGGRSPAQLSGGQLQRVALARALVHGPALILADEPTGNLDPATAERMLDLLQHQVRTEGAACLLVTHSASAAARADRVVRLTANGVVPA